MTGTTSVLRALPPPQDEYATWIRAQVPPTFRADVLPPDPQGRYSFPQCPVPPCERVAERKDSLCRLHEAQQAARPHMPRDEFLSSAESPPIRSVSGDGARGIFRLGAIEHPVVRDELAYGLSIRGQEGSAAAPVRAWTFNLLVDALNEARVSTILQCSEGDGARSVVEAACRSNWPGARAILDSTIIRIKSERGDRDARRALGARRGGSQRYSRHQDIRQPWLRPLVRRWTDFRLNTESGQPQHIGQVGGCVG